MMIFALSLPSSLLNDIYLKVKSGKSNEVSNVIVLLVNDLYYVSNYDPRFI